MIEIAGGWLGQGSQVLAEAVDGDWAFVLVSDPVRPVVHAAFAQRLHHEWRYKGGGTLPGMCWVNDGTGRERGLLGVGGPSSADTVMIEFGGDEFVVPVIDGYYT